MTLPRCYMCNSPATTVEHVPPRALFPEAKDVGGKNYRADLITVPSCPLHNTNKSHDDEFLMVSLAGIIGNNSIGYIHKLTKVDRAIRRSSYRLLEKALGKRQTTTRIDLDNNLFLEVIWGTPDAERLYKCFDHIVRGLHLQHFDKPLAGKVKSLLGYLFHSDSSAKNFTQFIVDRANLDLVGKQKHGKNPEVFYYQVTDPDESGLYLFRLCFYGGINVYSSVIPDSANPPKNLVFELMNHGIKTFISLGDITYEIN